MIWVLGALVGYPLELLVLVLLAMVIRHLSQRSKALEWMAAVDENTPPPEGDGSWGQLFDALYELQKTNLAERQRLESSIDYFERSFSAMPDAVIILDSEWRIDWCNRAANQWLGIQAPRDFNQYLLNLLRQPSFVRYINQRQFGESFYIPSPRNPAVELELRLSRFGNNEHMLFARDVTKVRQLDQMRRDFTDNVSHELRTPLTVITGYLDTLQDQRDKIDARLHRALDQMSAQGERMKSLITDIIWLSRLESVPLEVDESPLKVRELAESLHREAIELAGEQRLIEFSVDDDWLLQGSHKELYSAFSNLVFNAIKYTPSDTKITLIWQKTNFGATFTVKDNGPGIAPEHLSRLTERFYRVENSRATASGGTGLGLAIVKHIMQRHGGELRVSSIQGLGSSFVCHFPNSRLKTADVADRDVG
jgi:two-component system, OmpR family, phosphate regulon sensor histidine kinase PhoR